MTTKDGVDNMTGETRVSLVVGLLFIIFFGLIISRLTENKSPAGRGGQTASAPPAPYGVREGAAPRDTVTPRLIDDSHAPTPVTPAPPAPVKPEQARPTPAPAPVKAAASTEARKHLVKPGETLSRIAGAYYGQGNAARGVEAILKANADRVAGAKSLRVNTELTIPPLRNEANE